MKIHHIFIFTNDKGKSGNELLKFGVKEGSSRIHKGQGTANRKFYFENFFLELLWVHDENEINSDLIESTGLLKRSKFAINPFSRFGLCLERDEQSSRLFESSFHYQPEFFPDGNKIEIIRNLKYPTLPWTFRLPFQETKGRTNEPKSHSKGLRFLTSAMFEYSGEGSNHYLNNFINEKQINFEKTNREWLTLTFDNAIQGKQCDFESMELTIKY